MIKIFTKSKKGFSLVETLVAISVLLIVIAGPVSISMRSAKSTTYASENVQAFFLAQEGLELIEKARDDLFLQYINGTNLDPWTSFTSAGGVYGSCYTSDGCGIEWSTTVGQLANPFSCTSGCLLKNKNTGRSFFTYGSGQDTVFTRKINLERQGDAVNARSTVTWRTGSLIKDQVVEVNTYLYNTYGP